MAAHSKVWVNNVNVEVDLSNKELLFGVVRGIMVAENGLSRNGRAGTDSVDDDAVFEGISLAFDRT